MVHFEKAKNGSSVAVADGRYLNSRYNPEAEAKRFIADQLKGKFPNLVVIFGETNGYFRTAVHQQLPDCEIVSICFHAELTGPSNNRPALIWRPDSETGLHEFLTSSMPEVLFPGTQIIEWEPSAKAFPAIASKAANVLRDITAMRNGSITTDAAFGRLWLRNIAGNFLTINSVSPVPNDGRPLVITASGPSLSRSFSHLIKCRDLYQLWALPSSLPALAYARIKPDLVLVTDPGYYSRLHLANFQKAHEVPIAMPYSAVKRAASNASRAIILNQGLPLETALLTAAGIPHVRISPNGTVAGTALMLASMLEVPVIFAGLDFSGQDILSHVRPHAFDPILEDYSSRMLPTHTSRYARTFRHLLLPSQKGGVNSLTTYAAWFKGAVQRLSIPLFRLHPSGVEIQGMVPMHGSELPDYLQSAGNSNTGTALGQEYPVPTIKNRKEILSAVMNSWLNCLKSMEVPDKTHFMSNHQDDDIYKILYLVETRSCLRMIKSDNREKKSERFAQLKGSASSFLAELRDYANGFPL